MKSVKFSIKLLKMNQKHHKEKIKYHNKYIGKNLLKSVNSYNKRQLKFHQKIYDDLSLAIKTLEELKTKK